MSDGQITIPLVIRTANARARARSAALAERGELGDGDPGIKVIAPSTPADAKACSPARSAPGSGAVLRAQEPARETRASADGEHVEPLGKAKVLRTGADATIIALAAMVRGRKRPRRLSRVKVSGRR